MKSFEDDLVLEGDRIVEHQPSINDKALRLNLNKNIYGTFSEIGAGQETVRHFFRAGGASRTIAKAISAYDKQFSDAIYSVEADGRYVTENRLKNMLLYESNLMEERLNNDSDHRRMYFSYANTVTTIDFSKTFKGHGWVGVRFQNTPDGEYNEIILHIQFLETDARLQQLTLGILGVNLIYGAFYRNNNPKRLIESLYDHLDTDQIEIDTINFSGPLFENVDNRLMSLYMVKKGMTNAVMFGPDGHNVLPANTLFRKNVLLLRGSFRPVTLVNMDMHEKSLELFLKEHNIKKEDTIVVFEMTLNNLLMEGELNEHDFLDRAELLCHLGHTVMISNFREYYKVIEYISQYCRDKIGLSIGVSNMMNIFDPKYYQHLSGGVFEGIGKLFNHDLKVFLYPMLDQNNHIVTSKNMVANDTSLEPIYKYFLDKGQIIDIEEFDKNNLKIFSRDVFAMIKNHEEGWEKFLPEGVSKLIKEHRLFIHEMEETE